MRKALGVDAPAQDKANQRKDQPRENRERTRQQKSMKDAAQLLDGLELAYQCGFYEQPRHIVRDNRGW